MSVSDDSDYGALFERGHWEWNEEIQGLAYVSDVQEEIEEYVHVFKAPTGHIEFREDIDVIEQMRYKHRYQRKVKMGDPDVITVQDLKDVALFTAPMSIMSPLLINMLHVPTTERFIRALILYCQYYLQVTHIMINRHKQLMTRLRTPDCDVIERVYRDNLEDLRLLCAKEYCSIMIGADELKKFHHMGPQRKRSLTDKDAHLYETLVRMCLQIVWLALGRRHFHRLELEINRLFKSEIYNTAEHMLNTGYINKMSEEEKSVFLGDCSKRKKKLFAFSPMITEVFSKRNIDYRLLGLGIIKYDYLPPRLRYMQSAIASPEERLAFDGVVVGILGMPRNRFDIMLNPIAIHELDFSSRLTQRSGSVHSNPPPPPPLPPPSNKKSAGSRKSMHQPVVQKKLFPDIELPPADDMSTIDEDFPDSPMTIRPVPNVHRMKWLHRLNRMRKTRNKSRIF